MSLMQRAWIVLGLLVLGCGEPREFAVALEVKVEDDLATPLAGVTIEVDDVPVAVSDTQGLARATVHASGPGRISLSVQCPPGHRAPAARQLPLAAEQRAFRLVMRCIPSLRRLVVVVRAPLAEGAWVRADGKPLGQIQPDGSLHAELERAPDSDVRLSIDTSPLPELVPQAPVRDVHVTDRDEIIVFDQQFTRPAKSRTRAHAARKPTPPPRPYAIGPAR